MWRYLIAVVFVCMVYACGNEEKVDKQDGGFNKSEAPGKYLYMEIRGCGSEMVGILHKRFLCPFNEMHAAEPIETVNYTKGSEIYCNHCFDDESYEELINNVRARAHEE